MNTIQNTYKKVKSEKLCKDSTLVTHITHYKLLYTEALEKINKCMLHLMKMNYNTKCD